MRTRNGAYGVGGAPPRIFSHPPLVRFESCYEAGHSSIRTDGRWPVLGHRLARGRSVHSDYVGVGKRLRSKLWQQNSGSTDGCGFYSLGHGGTTLFCEDGSRARLEWGSEHAQDLRALDSTSNDSADADLSLSIRTLGTFAVSAGGFYSRRYDPSQSSTNILFVADTNLYARYIGCTSYFFTEG